jgi:hypothetical protein
MCGAAEGIRVMAGTATRSQIFLLRLVLIIGAALLVLALLFYGLSMEVQQRLWKDIIDRPGGPMTFRFILQPCMAAIAALIDGINDARLGRNPYLWTLLTNVHESADRLREGLISTARIILLGFGMDAIYQAAVLKTFYPGEMLVIAILLAFVPYVLLRGPFARIARWWLARKPNVS